MINFGLKQINIKQIKQGDTIIHNGQATTVTGNDIKHDQLMGTTVFGDSYNIGHKPVFIIG